MVAHFLERDKAALLPDRVKRYSIDILGVSPDKLPEDIESVSFKELGLDSLDVVELVMELEEEFEDDN